MVRKVCKYALGCGNQYFLSNELHFESHAFQTVLSGPQRRCSILFQVCSRIGVKGTLHLFG